MHVNLQWLEVVGSYPAVTQSQRVKRRNVQILLRIYRSSVQTLRSHILFYLRPLPQGTLNVRAVFSADLGVQWQRAVAGRGRMARALTESSGLSFGHWFPSLNGSSTFSCVYQSEWLYQQVARDSPRSTPSSSCGGFAACVSECICKLSGLLITAPITAGLSLFLQIAEECVSHC